MTTQYYKQGRTFSPPAQGTGIMLMSIGGIIIYSNLFTPYYGNSILLLISIIPISIGAWITFATSRLYTDKIGDGILISKFGLFPLKFSRKIKLEEFDAAVMKPTRHKYRVKQGIGAGMTINDPEFTDAFIGLHFKRKGKFEEELIMKGNGQEVLEFIKENLLNSNLLLFVGVIKKGYELKID